MKSEQNLGYDLGEKFFKKFQIFQVNIGGYQNIGIKILARPMLKFPENIKIKFEIILSKFESNI